MPLPLEDSHGELWRATEQLRRRYARLWLREHARYTLTRRGGGTREARLTVHAQLVERALAVGAELQSADRTEDLAPEAFHQLYVDRQTPVVFSGAGAGWPCARWTPEHIGEVAGEATIRLLRVAPNQPKGRPGEGVDVDYRSVAESMRDGGDLYARFSGLLHERPELVEDLDVHWFREMRRDHRTFENWGFFMGGTETATALHASIAPNLFLQITGRKRWYIYPAAAAGFFAPEVKGSPYFYSFLDVSDAERNPVAAHAPGWVAELGPGDVLYVPPFAWHQVHNLEATLGVGYRWMDVRQALKVSPLQTLLAATSTNPPPWRSKGHKDLPTLLDQVDY